MFFSFNPLIVINKTVFKNSQLNILDKQVKLVLDNPNHKTKKPHVIRQCEDGVFGQCFNQRFPILPIYRS